MDRKRIVEVLKPYFNDITLEEFVSIFINPVKAVESFYALCNGNDNGIMISLLFNPHRLDTLSQETINRTSNPMTIFESVKDKGSWFYTEKIDGLSRLYLYNLEHGINDPFYSAIRRGYNGVSYIHEFPPIVARTIYKRICGKKKEFTVLDPCAGWGGRMIGAASLGNVKYVACEPSTKTYDGLQKLGSWLQKLQPKFSYEIYKMPYEDFKDTRKFDGALTSPPYYNTEIYSDEKTNSLNRYYNYEKWVEGFYKPLILNTMKRLKKDGVFILNVGDRKYPLSESMTEICDSNGIYYDRIEDYLAGNGEGKEKFYQLSNKKQKIGKQRLF